MSGITSQLQRMAPPDEHDSESYPRFESSEHASRGQQNGRRTRKALHEVGFRDELIRKALHLLALIIPLGVWQVGRTLSLVACAGAALIALAADVLRVRSFPVATLIDRYFGFMMRQEERPPIGGPIILNGATWVLLSATLLVALFPMDVATVSFTAFMVADAAAAIVGRGIGRRHWPRSIRTVEGSLAFFAVGVAVMLLFDTPPMWIVVLAALAGTAAEIPSGPLNDNIRVPLVMAIVIYLCGILAA